MEKTEKSTRAQKEFVTLGREDLAAMLKDAAEVGAKAAMDKLDEERKRMHSKAVDRRLHNTKLLLRNYRMLKENSESSIFGRSQMKESAADILCSMMNLYDDEVIVDAIKRSASRTAIMVTHIDTMIGIYQTYCEKTSDLETRRYQVIYDMYISDKTISAKEIAKKQNMSKESVYSDLKIALERLSALIFGVDGLKTQ